MSRNWTARDLLERVKRDKQPVYFWLPYCDYFVGVAVDEAVTALDQCNPNDEFDVVVAGVRLYIREPAYGRKSPLLSTNEPI